MNVVDKLESFFEGMAVETTTYQCPRCGKHLESSEEQCPDCGEVTREVTEYVPVNRDLPP